MTAMTTTTAAPTAPAAAAGVGAGRAAAAREPVLLAVRNLGVDYPTARGVVHAVDGPSFDVERGEIVALVGESGCGKSATALAILRLIAAPGRIVSGEVLLEGRDLLQLPEAAMQAVRGQHAAMVFQEPMSSLNPVQRIGAQVAEPLLQHRHADARGAWQRAVDLLRRVNIPAPELRLRDYPHHFSGGMRQRVMMAMAMACGPRLLVADEPTTALDVTVQAQVLELLQTEVREHRTGLLLITHNLGVVARYADRVNVMYGGRIVESATGDDLYDQPLHPYTIGLLASVPRLDQPMAQRLQPIDGQPYDPLRRPRGCAFHPRCPHVMARCREAVPPVTTASTGHRVACWLYAGANA